MSEYYRQNHSSPDGCFQTEHDIKNNCDDNCAYMRLGNNCSRCDNRRSTLATDRDYMDSYVRYSPRYTHHHKHSPEYAPIVNRKLKNHRRNRL